jgi:D-lactate dehydrogenase
VVGVRVIVAITVFFERLLGARLPKWSAAIPLVPRPAVRARAREGGPDAVFFPSCMTRVMGRPRGQELSLSDTLLVLAERAGLSVVIPDDAPGACCGLTFGSKGYVDGHRLLLAQLVDRMWTWSREGAVPVVFDATSCLAGLLGATSLMAPTTRRRFDALRLVALAPHLTVRRLDRRVLLHPTCASRKLDEGAAMRAVAALCAARVEVPLELACCAMAGDRGLLFPELNASAVASERAEVLEAGDVAGHYANNLACEIGMSQGTSLGYTSFLYLVEEASRAERS